MQLVTRTQTALTTGASKVSAAISEAGGTLKTQIGEGLTATGEALGAVQDRLKGIVTKLLELGPLLDPTGLLPPLTAALGRCQADLQTLAGNLSGLGDRLLTAGQSLGGASTELQSALASLTALPDRLLAAQPDVAGLTAQLQALLLRGQGIALRAADVEPRLNRFAGELQALLPELNELRDVATQAVVSMDTNVAVEAANARAQAMVRGAETAALAELNLLKAEVQEGADAL